MSGTLAIASAALAAAVFAGRRPADSLNRLVLAPSGSRAGAPRMGVGTPFRLAPRSIPVRVLLGALAGAAAGAMVALPGGAIVGALASPAAILYWSRRKAKAARGQRTAEVAEACLALAGELRTGQPPDQAMAVVAAEWPDLFGTAARRAAVGGDPAAALRTAAEQPGAQPLAAVACAWEVSGHTGASLSSVLVTVSDSLRADAAVRREADAQLASVRATSRLLALLPIATLLLFSTGGGRTPVQFLLSSPYGVACLVAALTFIVAGLAWVRRTADQAMRTAWER